MRDFISIIAATYLWFSFAAFLLGSANATTPKWIDRSCQAKPVRAEKYFPAYKWGCYLFGEEQ